MSNREVHGHSRLRSGRKASPTYITWTGMRSRCSNPKATGFANYGGRGVRVCERWESFENFLEDMGERPAGTTLDRIDGAGNYEPGNCRWSTHKEQIANQRRPPPRTHEAHEPDQFKWLNSLGYTWREIGEFFGMKHSTVWLAARTKATWTPADDAEPAP